MRQTLIRPAKKWGHTQTGNFMGNIGQGRHYDPTKHMTLEQMRKKSIVYQDVYLDGLVQLILQSKSQLNKYKPHDFEEIFNLK